MDIDIKRALENVNFNTKEISEKEKILSDWRTEFVNSLDFALILKLCSLIKKYDQEEIGRLFKKYFADNDIEFNEDLSYFLLPYKTLSPQDHIESSTDLYFLLKGVLGISKNLGTYTSLNTFDFLSKKKDVSQRVLKMNKKQLNNISLTDVFFESISNIIIIDDFLGSGDSLNKLFKKHKDIFEFFRKNPQFNIKIKIICLSATLDGFSKIEESIKSYSFINIEKLNTSYPYYNNDSLNCEDRQKLKSILENWNKTHLSKVPKYNKDLTVCSYVNVPNNNVPILWKTDLKGKHKPLLKRTFSHNLGDKKKVKDKILFEQSESSGVW